ncbi:MAG TPA: adenosine kinase [Candidatus Coprenecus stercoravium]|uniref:Adenosine kinase n=1 Tax=Candidatus Coprenecus stercoravium TaxID=2840735 RepID=A0A9D2KAF2_9BACT|nr:adenosine kinase [Candidatus Coprenecus stercoravium]
MKSILGAGNALTDIFTGLPDDSLLRESGFPTGSVRHIGTADMERLLQALRTTDMRYVTGGCAANTVYGTAVLGMPSGFIGKVGNDFFGNLYRNDLRLHGIKACLMTGSTASGTAVSIAVGDDPRRTLIVCPGAASELRPDDLKAELFHGYDYFHIEGYLARNRDTFLKAVSLAKSAGCTISLDLASYNAVEANGDFFHNIVKDYVDIVFANETEAGIFTGTTSPKAAEIIAGMCGIAVVKAGAKGSYIQSGDEFYHIEACPADVKDTTGAGDLYASGFLYAHALGLPIRTCGEAGSIIASKAVEVTGARIDPERWSSAKAEIKTLLHL